MNHFLKISFIIPNNDINIKIIAIKHRKTPKNIIRYDLFWPPRCINIGPKKIGKNDSISNLILFKIFLFFTCCYTY